MERWMGLDVGDRRIGVSVSDWLGLTAQGVEVYHRGTGLRQDVAYLANRFRELEATGILVGFPRNMNGTVGPQAESVKVFGEHLGEACGVQPVFWDERLTTVQASQVLLEANLSRSKRKKVIDQVSAVFILQSFLDAQNAKRG
ncbi:MAG TPA: Holliday junction resolvase RuvX [Bacillota bacterium]|nr:Holliday junction resolvase RuvX [Bacillota bacterium]